MIRKALGSDLPQIMEIYKIARSYMKRTGNPNQWGDDKPTKEDIEEQLKKEQLYVLDDGDIYGVFVFFIGNDPTYDYIENGAWLNSDEYGVIHRIASSGTHHGVLKEVVDYTTGLVPNVRIDTHEQNSTMRHLLAKYGFSECGIIYLENGDPRVAYHIKK